MPTSNNDRLLITLVILVALMAGALVYIITYRSKTANDWRNEVKTLTGIIHNRDSAIISLRDRNLFLDTVVLTQTRNILSIREDLVKIQQGKTIIIKQYDEIPSNIRNLDRNELRKQFADTSTH